MFILIPISNVHAAITNPVDPIPVEPWEPVEPMCSVCQIGYQCSGPLDWSGGCCYTCSPTIIIDLCEDAEDCYDGSRPSGMLCTCPCSSDCVDDSEWYTYANGLQTFTSRVCDDRGCLTSSSQRCATGYYGIGFNVIGLPPCSKCPNDGTSVAGNNRTIDKCFLSGGGQDTSGTYGYNTPCYYKP